MFLRVPPTLKQQQRNVFPDDCMNNKTVSDVNFSKMFKLLKNLPKLTITVIYPFTAAV